MLFATALLLAQTSMELTLEVGEQRVIRIRGMQRIAPGCRNEHDIKTIGNDQLLVIAVKQCTGTHLIWRSDGSRIALLVRSVPATPKGDQAVPVKKRDGALTVVEDETGKTSAGTVVEIPEVLHDIRQERGPKGGTRIIGYNEANQRVTIDVAEAPLPPVKPDAGTPDAGARPDGGASGR